MLRSTHGSKLGLRRRADNDWGIPGGIKSGVAQNPLARTTAFVILEGKVRFCRTALRSALKFVSRIERHPIERCPQGGLCRGRRVLRYVSREKVKELVHADIAPMALVGNRGPSGRTGQRPDFDRETIVDGKGPEQGIDNNHFGSPVRSLAAKSNFWPRPGNLWVTFGLSAEVDRGSGGVFGRLNRGSVAPLPSRCGSAGRRPRGSRCGEVGQQPSFLEKGRSSGRG